MYLGVWEIDDLLTFPANTHDPTTGAAVDADSAPAYRVYENETATPILTGSMALLDSGNAIGFYSEQIALTVANGFEEGKSYTIYKEATVGGVTGTQSDTFQVGVPLNELLLRLGIPVDLGSGADIASNMLDLRDEVEAVPEDTNTVLSAAHGSGSWVGGGGGSGAGTGSVSWAYTLTNSLTDEPIADAEVWVTTDSDGEDIVASGRTDNFGVVEFLLDAGDYFLWRAKSGWQFTNPQEITVEEP